MEFNVLKKTSLQIWVILIVVNNGTMPLTIVRNTLQEKEICKRPGDIRFSESFPDSGPGIGYQKALIHEADHLLKSSHGNGEG